MNWCASITRMPASTLTSRFLLFTAVLAALLATSGCRTLPAATGSHEHTLTQVSAIDALLAGAYDGQMSLEQLREHGDMGIGTFAGLDGEMILLDGTFYQVKADGKVYRPGPQVATPFATVTHFTPDTRANVKGSLTMDRLANVVNRLAPGTNSFCVIRFEGVFHKMKVRSVPAQSRPYPPLVEVTRNQPVFELENTAGVLVGFRSPPMVRGINVPGFHWHFLSNDRLQGGHVLSFEAASGTVQLQACHRIVLLMPADPMALSGIDFSKDRSDDLNRAEK
jgi:acetolactate decarboxylase